MNGLVRGAVRITHTRPKLLAQVDWAALYTHPKTNPETVEPGQAESDGTTPLNQPKHVGPFEPTDQNECMPPPLNARHPQGSQPLVT